MFILYSELKSLSLEKQSLKIHDSWGQNDGWEKFFIIIRFEIKKKYLKLLDVFKKINPKPLVGTLIT